MKIYVKIVVKIITQDFCINILLNVDIILRNQLFFVYIFNFKYLLEIISPSNYFETWDLDCVIVFKFLIKQLMFSALKKIILSFKTKKKSIDN